MSKASSYLGRPCPGIDLASRDETGKEVEVGQHGELVARGANVMKGLLETTARHGSRIRNGMFLTGGHRLSDSDAILHLDA